MQATTDRLEFAPPPPTGVARSLTLAVLAHLVLLAALTWGVRWKRDAENLSVEAELWSAIPQQAAPKPVEAPPPPPPPPPAPAATPAPLPPAVRDADIALEREKKRREQEKQRELQEKLELQKKAEAEKKKELEARKKQQEKERLAKEKEKEKEKDKQEAERKADAERQRKEAEARKQQAQQEAQRQENIRRAQGLAGATGDANATGTAQRSSGPSASYAGRIRARIKPNIGFMDDVAGNPVAEIEVRAAPDGTITGRKLIKSSGVKSWDDAVLKAIDRTETLPRDTDGRVPPVMILELRPKD